jgi:mono/diheme cytochrome c family protein
MNETLFFVLGIALVVVALGVAFAGLRFEGFPGSKGLLAGATALFAALVVATGAFAWLNAEDEQEHREAELAAAAEENVAEGDVQEAEEEVGSDVPEKPSETQATGVDGAEVFASAGCTGCHTLADAGSTATTGPVLDAALPGKDTAFIKQSIVDPNAEIAKGYPPDVMPQTYGEQLSPEELDALVQYLAKATSAPSS